MAKVYAIVCTTGASVRDGQGKSGPWSMQKAFFFKLKITYYITYIEYLARSYLQMKLMKSTYSRYN